MYIVRELNNGTEFSVLQLARLGSQQVLDHVTA